MRQYWEQAAESQFLRSQVSVNMILPVVDMLQTKMNLLLALPGSRFVLC